MAQFPNMYPVDLSDGHAAVVSLNQMYLGNAYANRVGAIVTNQGENVDLGGSCAGTAVLGDGSTVALTGTVSGNEIYCDLPSGAYAADGPIEVFITWVSGENKTTLLAGFGNVRRTETGTYIDPGTVISDVAALIESINTAVASIPSDYSALLHTLAPDFSASTAYSAGDYAWYNGTLYHFTANHAAGSWTGTDTAAAVIGNNLGDLKSALGAAVTISQQDVNVDLTKQLGYYKEDGTFVSEVNRESAAVSPVSVGETYKLTCSLGSTLIYGILYLLDSTVVDTELPGTGSRVDYTDYVFTIPAGCNTIIVQSAYSNIVPLSLKKVTQQAEFKAYTKAESDAKYAENDDLQNVENDIYTDVTSWDNIELSVDSHGYYNIYGTYADEANRRNAIITDVGEGEKYRLSTAVSSTLIPAIMYYNGSSLLSYEKTGTGTLEIVTNYEFTIPANCNKIIVQNSTGNSGEFELEKKAVSKELNVYTKQEADTKFDSQIKKYGIKWEISNPDDLGQRCFDAVGLSATIGIGPTNGSSDFDTIYPWSEMKRCNIKQNANGAKIVTFEGETGFALDGSNGDVFVRIPKFYYERYRDNGYEYRVISATGNNPHPAFMENGAVLDEIFVGAFEGLIDDDALISKANVIPTSNEVGQTFLTAAQNKGDGYTLYDMRCVDAVWTLMAIEYGCRNTNRILGYGYADFLQAVNTQYGVVCDTAATATNVFSASISYSAARIANMPVGSSIVICKGDQLNCIKFAKLTGVTSDANHWYLAFDGDPVDLDTTCFIGSAGCFTNFCETVPSGALSWHTGRANWQAGSNTKNPVRYRWIENIVGSLWAFLPDITFHNLQMYQCKNIKDYVMFKHISPYLPIGSTYTENTDNGEKADAAGANCWITGLDHDIFAKGVDFGRAYNKTLTSTKAFGAYYYLSGGTRCIVNGGGFDHLYRCNVLTSRAWVDETAKWYLYGARLIYKNVE